MSAAPSGLPVRNHLVYAIGDIHGCPGMLEALLAEVLADAQASGDLGRPRVVLLGDLVDRGPDSKGVIDIVLSDWFSATFDAIVLRGNHEDMLNEAVDSPQDAAMMWLRHGGAETVESYGVEFGGSGPRAVVERFVQAMPPEHRTFLAELPYSLRDGDLFMAHAGVRAGRPLEMQSPIDLMWIHEGFLDFDGDFGATVVHGHTPTSSLRIQVLSNRIAVDTGCGYAGGMLSAAAVSPDGTVRALSVGPAPHGMLDLPRLSVDASVDAVHP